MNAFYSLWTAPADGARVFCMQDHDLACLMLSVAAYERYNGRTRLYADEQALAWFDARGLSDIFSGGIRSLSVPEDIDPKVFWAAGKLCALAMEETPCVMLDTDLIVWRSIGKTLKDKNIAVIHREELNPGIYPDPGAFAMEEGYRYPGGWDFLVRPANTALLFIREPAFRDAYVQESLRFMRACREREDRLCPMVFAEQRILPMVAKERGLSIWSFCERMEELREQSLFTHLWGHKNVLKYNRDEQKDFVRRCLLRMQREFPEMYERAAALAEFEEYLC